jgi:hypothetical protein
MMYIPRFIKDGSFIQKLIDKDDTDTQHGDRISPLFQNKASRLKMAMKNSVLCKIAKNILEKYVVYLCALSVSVLNICLRIIHQN